MVNDKWYWKCDGRVMPTPKTATIDEYDLDSQSTGRPESGILHRDRVRHNVMRVSFTFANLNAEQARTIRASLAPAQVEITIRTFYGTETRVMYAGDRHWEEWFDSDDQLHVNLQVQLSEY